MKFMLLIYIDDKMLNALPAESFDSMMRECLTHAEELETEGVLFESQQLEAASTAKSLRRRGGRLTTIDGPYAEAKEVFGGFNLIEAENMAEAVKIAASFPWANIGCVEVRPVRDIGAVRQRVFANTSRKGKPAAADATR
jgi:hypothetical protein